MVFPFGFKKFISTLQPFFSLQIFLPLILHLKNAHKILKVLLTLFIFIKKNQFIFLKVLLTLFTFIKKINLFYYQYQYMNENRYLID